MEAFACIWLATREKGHSHICINCRLGSACAVRDSTLLLSQSKLALKKKKKKKKKKMHEKESVVSHQPARTAQADMKRQFTQMSECSFEVYILSFSHNLFKFLNYRGQ